MTLKLTISEARARLPELAQRVMGAPGEIVIIEHRDRKERLVLTTESHYRMLEAAMLDSKKQGSAPFKLLGSLHSALTDEELEAALAAARAAQQAEDERRVQRLLED